MSSVVSKIVGPDSPRILVVGDFHSAIYEKAIYDAFHALGYDTHRFAWCEYFGIPIYLEPLASRPTGLRRLWLKAQNKFLFGPALSHINRDLLAKVREVKPDLVFVYRGTHIFASTRHAIKTEGVAIFGYNNDDPFSAKHPPYLWKHFVQGIPFYDHIFAYREKNIEDYVAGGVDAGKVSLLRSYYIKDRNFPIDPLPKQDYACDVLFAGHYEDDGRDEHVKAFLEAGINFRLYGPGWRASKHYAFIKEKLGEIRPLMGDEYNLALNSAKICLVFLSKLNNDMYTRRCFEILAAKRFMLSEYTDDLASMFAAGKEAAYFTDTADLLEKVAFYLARLEVVEQMRTAGYERLLQDGHEVTDRARTVMQVYEAYKAKEALNTP